MDGVCKVHKDTFGNSPSFRPILPEINTTSFKLETFPVPILKPLNRYKYAVKDSLAFAQEIVKQAPEFSMGTLDIDSLFTNTTLEETIEICTNKLFENTGRAFSVYQK